METVTTHSSDAMLARWKVAAIAQHKAEATRSKDLSAGRALIRKAGIRTSGELLAAMQNVLSACSTKSGTELATWRDALGELCCDMDGDVNYGEAA